MNGKFRDWLEDDLNSYVSVGVGKDSAWVIISDGADITRSVGHRISEAGKCELLDFLLAALAKVAAAQTEAALGKSTEIHETLADIFLYANVFPTRDGFAGEIKISLGRSLVTLDIYEDKDGWGGDYCSDLSIVLNNAYDYIQKEGVK